MKILFVEYCAKDYLDGTQNMDAMTELAYRRIVDMIYSTNDKLLDNDSLQYATKTGAKWKKIRKELIEVHKKIFIENGFIRNSTCGEKLEKSRKNIEQKRTAQAAMIEKRNSLKENETGLAAASAAVPAAALANYLTQESNKKEVVDVSARATLKKKIGEAAGMPYDDPRWFGSYARVDQWLADGWDAELDILPTIAAVIAKKRDGPPRTLAYFEQAIANAHATRLAPTPKGKPNETPTRNSKTDELRTALDAKQRELEARYENGATAPPDRAMLPDFRDLRQDRIGCSDEA